jgi:capsular exopolysaccharide synthesis family protein
MITSLSANKSSADKSSADRAANQAAAVRGDSKAEIVSYYASLLRLAEAQQNAAGLANYVLGVTSCGRGQGVTTVAVNLAIVAARNGARRVLLIDANSQNPGVAKCLGLKPQAGLADVVGGSVLLGETLQPTSIAGLSVLTPGSGTKKLGSDFSVAEVSALLDELRNEFDLIIFDLPQADELSECYAFAEMLDGLFLVVEAGRVDVAVARRVKQRLDHCQANLLGAIYNKHS